MAYAPVLPDAAERAGAGASRLSAAVNTQATVLAFNDIFRVVMAIALLTFFAIAIDHARTVRRDRIARPAKDAA